MQILSYLFVWGGFLKTMGILAIIWLSLCALALLFLHIKSHCLLKSILINAILGFTATAIINLTQNLTGVYIPLNWWTVGGSGILGLPYVCGLLLLQTVI